MVRYIYIREPRERGRKPRVVHAVMAHHEGAREGGKQSALVRVLPKHAAPCGRRAVSARLPFIYPRLRFLFYT